MSIDDTSRRTVESVADEYIRSKLNSQQTIVMSAALTAVRAVLGENGVSDQEVSSAIARRALASGLSVEFDYADCATHDAIDCAPESSTLQT